MELLYLPTIVSLGTLPSEEELANVPRVETGGTGGTESGAAMGATGNVAGAELTTQAASLMALLRTRADPLLPAKQTKVWLGAGLGSVARKTYEKILRWDFIDMAELQARNPMEKPAEAETQRLVVLPGFEVSQARQKPINNIIVWANCYARYVGAMSKVHPTGVPGLMAHMITVMKAYTEVEDPAWRIYDEAFREKMAATGCKLWQGMDVQLYQEVCAGRLRKRQQGESPGNSGRSGMKRAGEERQPSVCWQYNAGGCRFGATCKFAHSCGTCYGPHPKLHCPREGEKKRKLS